MEVILREDVPHLGSIGDIVKVKPGYARNFLFPRGLAVIADPRQRRVLEHNKRVIAEKRERVLNAARSLAQRLEGLRVVVRARAGQEGKLFGSVTNLDIERALSAQGLAVERRRIRLDEPIKHLGEHRISIHLEAGVDAEVRVHVEPEGGEETSEPEVADESDAAGESPGRARRRRSSGVGSDGEESA
jgi:large subunit ribosomal protein L9